MIQYGLISRTDAACLEKTIDLICEQFPDDRIINTCQIGVFDGQTDRGIYEYVTSKMYYVDFSKGGHKMGGGGNLKCNHTAIDNEKDKLIKLPFPECKFIRGNSNEVYNQLEDNSQHLIFVDGDHSFPAVVADWYCYEPKVRVGGYFAFHDSGAHIKPFKDWQRRGSEKDLGMYISVRKALKSIGVLLFAKPNWQVVFDEADTENPAGGICVFKKLY